MLFILFTLASVPDSLWKTLKFIPKIHSWFKINSNLLMIQIYLPSMADPPCEVKINKLLTLYLTLRSYDFRNVDASLFIYHKKRCKQNSKRKRDTTFPAVLQVSETLFIFCRLRLLTAFAVPDYDLRRLFSRSPTVITAHVLVCLLSPQFL